MAKGLARASLGVLVLAACGCQPPTEVTLVITTNVDCADVEDTAILVGNSSADVETRDPSTITQACAVGRIGSIVVIPPSGNREAAFAVKVVTGVDVLAEDCLKGAVPNVPGTGHGCIYARRDLGFIPETPLLLPIVMHKACIGIDCGPGRTCLEDGTCGSATISDPSSCARPGGCDESALGPGMGSGSSSTGTSSTGTGGHGGMMTTGPSSSSSGGTGGMGTGGMGTGGMGTGGQGGMMSSSSSASSTSTSASTTSSTSASTTSSTSASTTSSSTSSTTSSTGGCSPNCVCMPACVPTECVSSVCDGTMGTCTMTNMDGAMCQGTGICSGGVCTFQCMPACVSTECVSSVCDMTMGTCMTTNLDGASCQGTGICSGGVCTFPDAGCSPNCVCMPPCPMTECTSSTCDMTMGTCSAPFPINEGLPCSLGICMSGVCVPNDGGPPDGGPDSGTPDGGCLDGGPDGGPGKVCG